MNYYFTYGTLSSYPFEEGHTLIKNCPSEKAAKKIFQFVHPYEGDENTINCACIYSEDEFKSAVLNKNGSIKYPSMMQCHETIDFEKVVKEASYTEFNKLFAKYGVDRSEMTEEQEREFVNKACDIYESYGFHNVLPNQTELNDEDIPYIGKPFIVERRCVESDGWDLECLPAWHILFEDGHRMEAYPEEICLAED